MEQSASLDVPAASAPRFDVFLSYNSRDRAVVQRIAERLQRAGLKPWWDRWSLRGGQPWQDELPRAIDGSEAFAFFVGPHGEGDWAREELYLAQDRATTNREHFYLIPVLLPGVDDPFDRNLLPPFLRARTWVDLRAGADDSRGLHNLICAVTGVPFGPDLPRVPGDDVCPYR